MVTELSGFLGGRTGLGFLGGFLGGFFFDILYSFSEDSMFLLKNLLGRPKNTEDSSESSFKKESYLKLAEQSVNNQHDTFLYLDKKAWQNLSVSTVIIGLFSALNLKSLLDPNTDVPATVLVCFVFAFISYAFSIVSSLQALRPTDFTRPFKITYEEALDVLNEKDEYAYYAWLISSISEAIKQNKPILEKKAQKVEQAILRMGITLSFILVAAIAIVADRF